MSIIERSDPVIQIILKKTKHLAPAKLEVYELMLRGLELYKQGYVSYEQAVETYNLG